MDKRRLTLNSLVIVPNDVARQAWKGLQLRQEYGRGGTSVGVATARLLRDKTQISVKKILHIANYFPRHAGDNLDQKNPPSNGWIAWLLWGGNAGRRWAERVKKQYQSQTSD